MPDEKILILECFEEAIKKMGPLGTAMIIMKWLGVEKADVGQIALSEIWLEISPKIKDMLSPSQSDRFSVASIILERYFSERGNFDLSYKRLRMLFEMRYGKEMCQQLDRTVDNAVKLLMEEGLNARHKQHES